MHKGLSRDLLLKGLNLLLFCSLTIFAWADDQMTLRPNGVGTNTNLSVYPSGANWAAVDDVTSDSDTTYVYNATTSYVTDTYNIPDFIGRGTINSVTVYAVVKRVASGSPLSHLAYVKVGLYANSTWYAGSQNVLTTSYTTYSSTWTGDPSIPPQEPPVLNWTWEAINNLQIGISLKGYTDIYGSQTAKCTQVYAVVDYNYGQVIIF